MDLRKIEEQHKTLRNNQLKQLEVMTRVFEICDANGLQCFMFYGTLLGARRHQGIIPWDNDIDLAAKRDEFLKIRNLIKQDSELYLEDVCYNSINTAGLSRVFSRKTNEHIDLFVLDYARQLPWKFDLIIRSAGRFLGITKLSDQELEFLFRRFNGNTRKIMIIKFGRLLRNLFSSARIERIMYRICVSPSETGSLICLENPYKKYISSDYVNPVKLKFENSEYLAPSSCERSLKVMYGDFLKIPPEGLQWLEEEKLLDR